MIIARTASSVSSRGSGAALPCVDWNWRNRSVSPLFRRRRECFEIWLVGSSSSCSGVQFWPAWRIAGRWEWIVLSRCRPSLGLRLPDDSCWASSCLLSLSCCPRTWRSWEASLAGHCRQSSCWCQHCQRCSEAASAGCSTGSELLPMHSRRLAAATEPLRREVAAIWASFAQQTKCLERQSSDASTRLLSDLNWP